LALSLELRQLVAKSSAATIALSASKKLNTDERQVLEDIQDTRRTIKDGDAIIHAGDVIDKCYIVRSGWLARQRTSVDGQMVTTNVYLPGDILSIHLGRGGPVDRFLADGAYDGEPTSDLLAARFGSTIEVKIPPPRNAIVSPNAAQNLRARDCNIADITARGRMAWQKATGYNQRSRGETLMGRWKADIGTKLNARNFENQKTEAKVGVRVLNRMAGLGRPDFERTA